MKGKKVFVQHAPRYNHNGDVAGIAYRKGGHVVQEIAHEYIHRDDRGNRIVRLLCGDIWSVRPVNHPDYQYATV